ncbi:hypothetical protein [Helicobacter sp.]|uniref:hypothetical protein n=1 Tax=Helicobacter sp. TaxID=218 RepID=UPI002A764709|nr:hypothetical protein [Helicobacter sp.]MDY2585317.1 hypothetical protein [Helicobacter sp.]
MNLLDKWISAIKRIARTSKNKAEFQEKMLIGLKGYYSVSKYFECDGLIFYKKGVESYPVDTFLGAYQCKRWS